MANVMDVAQYILEKQGEMTTIKLQKLVYYCQAWALVWTDEPLFEEKIEAWANGPVCPLLFAAHEGTFKVNSDARLGDSGNLSADNRDVIDNVLKSYGDKSSHWLVELTHIEEPWKKTRQGTPAGERCDREICHADMAEYYSGL